MCRPEECPLQQICDQRVDIADALLRVQQADTQQRADTQIARAEQGDFDNDNPLVVIGLILPALRDSLNDGVLVCEINEERFDQSVEMIQCPHPNVTRKYGMFGKVVMKECGSDSRKQRLAEHLERNPALEGTALED